MSWKTGTSTDFVDLLDDLITFATADQAVSAVVAAGGAGYSVGDKLTVSGGTFGTAATFEVTGEAAGAVTTVELLAGGDYTVTPGNPAATTGGGGAGCTLTVTYVTPWAVQRRTQKAASAVVGAGGAGYTVNDQLTVVGGVEVGTAAVFNVDTVAAGVVTAVSLVTAGHYGEVPANPAATTGGTGTGCTLTVTYADNDTNFNQAILKSDDDVYVGIRTFKDGTSAYNWEVAGMTGYAAGLLFENQPGISPGRYDDPAPAARPGCYVPLNNAALTYWFSVTPRRIKMVAKSGSSYPNLYLGFLNQFGTASEYAYPLLVMGCQSEYGTVIGDTKIAYSGMCDPIADNDDDLGPGYVRDPGGNWRQVANSEIAFGARVERNDCVVWPCGQPQQGTGADQYFNQVYECTDFVPPSGNPGTQQIEILQTIDSESVLWPATVIESNPDDVALGELDRVWWVSAVTDGANIVTEDTVTIGNRVYRVFQNCNRSNNWALFALEEA